MSYPFKIQMNNSLRMANGWPMRSVEPVVEQRIFITTDPAIPTYYTMQNAVVLSGDFELYFEFASSSLSTMVLINGGGGGGDFIQIPSSNSSINVRFGGVSRAYASSPLDGKYRKLKVVVSSGACELFLDDISLGSQGVGVGATFTEIGRLTSGSQYFSGILANPTITDTSDPLNPVILESWKLDQPHPINTEQSSSGNNLLTYVGATEATRELFTKDGDDWLGIERVVNGGFDSDTSDWSPLSSALLSVVNKAMRITNVGNNFGKAYQAVPINIGSTHKLVFTGVGGTSADKKVRIGSVAGGVDIFPNTSYADGVNSFIVDATTVSTGNLAFANDGVDSSYNDVDSVSMKRILQAP